MFAKTTTGKTFEAIGADGLRRTFHIEAGTLVEVDEIDFNNMSDHTKVTTVRTPGMPNAWAYADTFDLTPA